MSDKGGQYERDICKMLSYWWTNGDADTVFWRVRGSGGRAKRRGRAGKQTSYQHGDIYATDPAGIALIKLLTIEIKRGYSDDTIAALLDRPIKKPGNPTFNEFLCQIIESADQAGSCSWMLIHKRDKREPMVYFPRWVFQNLREAGCFSPMPCPFGMARVDCSVVEHPMPVYWMRLEEFLQRVDPEDIKRIDRRENGK